MAKTKLKDMSENIEEPQVVEETNDVPENSAKSDDLTNRKSESSESSEKPSKKDKASAKPKQRSKKYVEVAEKVEKTKEYPLEEALDLLKELSYTKFEGTVELHINTSQKNLRGLVSLPYAAGKTLRVAAMGKGADTSGADLVIDDKAMPDLEKGRINFDVLVVSPDQMPKIARLARILGPRGLMPNPKNGTISDDIKKAVTELQGGKTEYKTQKDSQVIHLSVGKVNQEKSEVAANIKTLYQTLGKSRVKRVTLAPTMGPGIRVSLSSI